MTMQEKIKQLALAALHAPPPSNRIPKPATFTPPMHSTSSADPGVSSPPIGAAQGNPIDTARLFPKSLSGPFVGSEEKKPG
jgi:hypothetical protein